MNKHQPKTKFDPMNFFYMIVLYTENAKDPKKFKIFHCQIYLVLFKCTLSYLQLYPLA